MADRVTNVDLAPNAAPAHFVDHAFERTWTVRRPVRPLWEWLNDPRTFTESQVWPFRVEFIDDPNLGVSGMQQGVLNIHHGPLLSVHGRVGDVRPPDDDGTGGYRDLQYGYGSYAISLRLVRPTRLQFWVDRKDDATSTLRVRLDSFVTPKFERWWERGLRLFWSRFPNWAERG